MMLVGQYMDAARALMMVMVMSLASLSGCFGEDDVAESISEDSLKVSPSIIPAGEWVTVTLTASDDVSVFFPYFLQDPGSMRAQNGTVFDLKSGESVSLNALFPPRNSEIVLLMGDYGRDEWPIRAPDVSWSAWANGATQNSASILATPNQDEGGEWDWIVSGNDSGGDVVVKSLETIRSQRADLNRSRWCGC